MSARARYPTLLICALTLSFLINSCGPAEQVEEHAPAGSVNAEHPAWRAISDEDKVRYRMALLSSADGRLNFTADYLTPFDATNPRHLVVEEGAFQAQSDEAALTDCEGLRRLTIAPEISGSPPHGMFFTQDAEQFLTATGAYVRCVPPLDRCLFFVSEGAYSAQTTIDRERICEWGRLDRALRSDLSSWLTDAG